MQKDRWYVFTITDLSRAVPHTPIIQAMNVKERETVFVIAHMMSDDSLLQNTAHIGRSQNWEVKMWDSYSSWLLDGHVRAKNTST